MAAKELTTVSELAPEMDIVLLTFGIYEAIISHKMRRQAQNMKAACYGLLLAAQFITRGSSGGVLRDSRDSSGDGDAS